MISKNVNNGGIIYANPMKTRVNKGQEMGNILSDSHSQNKKIIVNTQGDRSGQFKNRTGNKINRKS